MNTRLGRSVGSVVQPLARLLSVVLMQNARTQKDRSVKPVLAVNRVGLIHALNYFVSTPTEFFFCSGVAASTLRFCYSAEKPSSNANAEAVNACTARFLSRKPADV